MTATVTSEQTHTCECGFTWKHGLSGSHHCGPYYQKRIAELIKQRDDAVSVIQAIKGADMSGWLTSGFAIPVELRLRMQKIIDDSTVKDSLPVPDLDAQTIANLQQDIERSIPCGVEAKEPPPQQPSCTNDHVAEGCEKFSEGE